MDPSKICSEPTYAPAQLRVDLRASGSPQPILFTLVDAPSNQADHPTEQPTDRTPRAQSMVHTSPHSPPPPPPGPAVGRGGTDRSWRAASGAEASGEGGEGGVLSPAGSWRGRPSRARAAMSTGAPQSDRDTALNHDWGARQFCEVDCVVTDS